MRRRRGTVQTECVRCGAQVETKAEAAAWRTPACPRCVRRVVVFDAARRIGRLPINLMATYRLDHRGQPRRSA
jgi:DNA-directed RNA polymerase subunit RPC12/RpoP